jgi:hypothetical protein
MVTLYHYTGKTETISTIFMKTFSSILYNVCPRCNSQWQFKLSPQCACGMAYHIPPAYHCLVLRSFLGIEGNYLTWDIDNHFCLYGNWPECVCGTATKLPWLPYDITPEKLKMYILFS